MSAENPLDPIVVGRSPDSFAAAAQNAVDAWESRRGRPPEELTTLQVADMYDLELLSLGITPPVEEESMAGHTRARRARTYVERI